MGLGHLGHHRWTWKSPDVFFTAHLSSPFMPTAAALTRTSLLKGTEGMLRMADRKVGDQKDGGQGVHQP